MSLALVMPSCENNDNSDELMSGLNGLEKRVEALEALQDQITAIQELLEAAQRNHITSVEDVTDEAGNVIGYKINFQDSDPITIYNGGSASGPQITVEEEDGELYWKVNGEWLLDGNENKVPAQGKTPTFRVNPDTGKWEYSFNETDWSEVQGAPAGGGSGIIVDTTNEDYVVFKLDGETDIKIPWYKPLDIRFSIDGVENDIFQLNGVTTSYSISYEITGDIDNPIVKAFADNKAYDVKVVKGSENKKGTIEISHTDAIEQGQVTVLVSDGDQRTIMRTITFVSSDAGTIINVTTKNYTVAAIGNDNLQIDFESDVKMADLEIVIPDDAKSWITCSAGIETRALTPYKCVLEVLANDTDESRSATITLRDKTYATVVAPVTITINQVSATISVENVTAGGLQAALADKSPETITSLKISGSLDDADFTYLSSLVKIKGGNPVLKKLDMANVTISTSGGNKIPDNCFNSLYDNTVLETLVLPSNLEKIGTTSFAGLKIKSIEIPASVTYVNNTAFKKCALEAVIIRGDINLNSSSGAFSECSSLTSVTIYGTNPKGVQAGDFSKDASNTKIENLYVSAGMVDAYKSAGWESCFTNILEIE